ncbi:TPA: AlpA family phage regulatory protein [Enterobacter asburiae]|nr:AlpA family phage regulatory protein [Enterobacter asburiae]
MFLNKTEVAKHIGLCSRSVAHLIKTDPTFPKPVYITPVRPHWLDAAIDAWAQARSDAVNQKPKGGRAG